MSVAEQQVIIAAARAAHAKKNAANRPARARTSGGEMTTALVVAVLTVAMLALAIWRNG